MPKKEMKAVIDEYSKLYTCAISDAIDELGLEPGFVDARIRPIYPGARMVGYAGTLKFIPSEEQLDDDVMAKLGPFIRKLPKFPIVCIDMSNQMIAAGLGQSTGRILQQLGVRGALVDGPVRDIAQVIDLKFPMFARGIICSSVRGRMVIDFDGVMKPINCGGRIINVGDLIFGDINGVVVVKQEYINKVLEKAKEMISTDKWWFEQLEKGRDPADIEKERPLP
jgi:4-hydroxy-4-methyl-2-oxoglutarate aldolase